MGVTTQGEKGNGSGTFSQSVREGGRTALQTIITSQKHTQDQQTRTR